MSGFFVPAVITIAVLTTIVWLLLGRELGYALARGISVLVISCPCALGLARRWPSWWATVWCKNGILFKTAASLEAAGRTQIVALDKTGTITSGEPKVTDILPAEAFPRRSCSPLPPHWSARASTRWQRPCWPAPTRRSSPPRGIRLCRPAGQRSGRKAGRRGDLWRQCVLYRHQSHRARTAAGEGRSPFRTGKTPLFFGGAGRLLGIIAVADTIKEDSPRAIRELQAMGIRVVMLTGDNQRTAAAIGRQAGVDEVIAGVLPDGKEAVIRQLQASGKVAMVGDGINDAPALTRADTGIAIGAAPTLPSTRRTWC